MVERNNLIVLFEKEIEVPCSFTEPNARFFLKILSNMLS